MIFLLRPSLAVAALLAAGSAAWAQSAAPSAATSPEASAAASSVVSARAQCRAQIDGRSLTGPERRAAMRDCMRPQHDACRQEAVAKGLAKGPDRKTFMHQCLHGTLAKNP